MMNKRVKMGGACILALALTLAGLKLPSAYAALPVDLSQKGASSSSWAKNVYPEPAIRMRNERTITRSCISCL